MSSSFGARRRERGGAAALWTPFESMKTRNSPSPCSPLKTTRSGIHLDDIVLHLHLTFAHKALETFDLIIWSFERGISTTIEKKPKALAPRFDRKCKQIRFLCPASNSCSKMRRGSWAPSNLFLHLVYKFRVDVEHSL